MACWGRKSPGAHSQACQCKGCLARARGACGARTRQNSLGPSTSPDTRPLVTRSRWLRSAPPGYSRCSGVCRGHENDLETHPLAGNSLTTPKISPDDRTLPARPRLPVPACRSTCRSACRPACRPACLVPTSRVPPPRSLLHSLTSSVGHSAALPLSLQTDLCSVWGPVVTLSSSLANHI